MVQSKLAAALFVVLPDAVCACACGEEKRVPKTAINATNAMHAGCAPVCAQPGNGSVIRLTSDPCWRLVRFWRRGVSVVMIGFFCWGEIGS